jgi:hypothetical protein
MHIPTSPLEHDFSRILVHAVQRALTDDNAAEPSWGGPSGWLVAQAQKTCPVVGTGTLSDVSWGETAGLYPSKENRYQPDKWDAAKTCELLAARGAVDIVGGRGERVQRAQPGEGAIEQKLKPYHLKENFPPASAEIADLRVKWFYLSNSINVPVHPGARNSELVKTYGSFYNNGGGDVPAGATYIHFYRFSDKAK